MYHNNPKPNYTINLDDHLQSLQSYHKKARRIILQQLKRAKQIYYLLSHDFSEQDIAYMYKVPVSAIQEVKLWYEKYRSIHKHTNITN